MSSYMDQLNEAEEEQSSALLGFAVPTDDRTHDKSAKTSLSRPNLDRVNQTLRNIHPPTERQRATSKSNYYLYAVKGVNPLCAVNNPSCSTAKEARSSDGLHNPQRRG
jgi:hypothetical protein